MGTTKIYLIENCYGNNNKVYIGKTKNSRKIAHAKTFGNQITYTYIDEISSLNREDWGPLESYWIEQFRQWGFEIMNKNKKGGGGPEFVDDNIKILISNKLKGKKKPKRSKTHCENLSRSLTSVSRKGSGRKKGITLSELEIEIRKRPRKPQTQLTIEKRVLKNTGKKRTQDTKLKMSNSKKGKPSNNTSKQVYQYDINNILIKIWDKVTTASKDLNIRRQGIITCATGKSKTYKNYIWKYY
jgi:hypothetical protein